MNKYRNISKQTQTLIGFGIVEPEGTIETGIKINNPNFKLVFEAHAVGAPEKEPREVEAKQDVRPKFNRKTS